MGLKLIAVASLTAAAVSIGGYVAIKEDRRHRYDPAVEQVVLQGVDLVHRYSGSAAAGFDEYQITHLLVRVPGAGSGDEGATKLAKDLRARGWTLDNDPSEGFEGSPPGESVAVAIEGFQTYMRRVGSDFTGEFAELERHAGDRARVVLVTLEAQS